MRKLLALIILLALIAGGVWIAAGRAAGPAITINQPTKVIGQAGQLDVTIDTPGGTLTRLDIALEQDGTRTPVFSLPGAPDPNTKLAQETDRRLHLTRGIGKRDLPQLKAGKARITITAVRPVLFGRRQVETTVTRDFDVRLTPPQVAVLSLHHFINHGGSEMVVYRVTPADVASGVRVGDQEYPGFPAAGAGIANPDPALRVAFFALLWDQDLSTPINVFARDEAGNEGHGAFDFRVFPKVFRKSRIEIDDRFLSKVVPAILQNSAELKVDDPSDLLASFLRINRDLRKENNATIAALAAKSAPKILWQGPFKQLSNTAVEAGFADQRTYVYKGQDVDHQVHLGFDLASTAAAPVLAANHGIIVHASWLGIYGNCVIIDHGMGLQSLYGHLSSISVKVGDSVNRGAELGRSGSTGMAGGDHLHFTMLLGGNAITPIDWWSTQWVEDRITRKLREAGTAPAAPTAAPPSQTPAAPPTR
jgi:murein DD-endopeptidase MepM/ murein hydrolase activator NlpD